MPAARRPVAAFPSRFELNRDESGGENASLRASESPSFFKSLDCYINTKLHGW